MTQPYPDVEASMASDLVERLRAVAKKEHEYAINSARVAELLAPELEKFKARDEAGWNTYTVRMAVDHRNGAKRGAGLGRDIDEALNHIQALEARLAKLDAPETREAIARCIVGPRGSGNMETLDGIYSMDELRVFNWSRASKAERNNALQIADAILAMLKGE